jgi:membrane protein insertase Oxa1/YidC/SpoIIIJ
MADMIIVISFFTVGFTSFLYIMIETVLDLKTTIKLKRKMRKEREAEAQKKTEEPGT